MKALLPALAACCALCAAACTATETGNPISAQRLALTARSSAERVALAPDTDAELTVSEAWVGLGDLRFEQAERCDSGGAEQQADIEGPIVADLAAEPELIEFAIEEARYCRVRVPLERAESDADLPAELADYAILIRGALADGTPFAIRSDQTLEADIRSRGEPFSVARADAALILAFDVGRWLDGVELDGAAVQDDGVIWVDHDRERELLDRFEENVEAAMELFRDLDDDERLDAEEAETPLASGG